MSGDGEAADAGEAPGPGGDCAEQPRQISRKLRNAHRTMINRNHLNVKESLDYLMAAGLALATAQILPTAKKPGRRRL